MIEGWLQLVLTALAVIAACWAMLVVLAKTLPDGLAKQLASFLPDCATMVWRLRRDPRVPTRVRIVLVIAGLWVLSPVDLIPEFLPVIGPLDDVVVVALALRYAARHVPTEALRETWPGDAEMLERLLSGRPRTT